MKKMKKLVLFIALLFSVGFAFSQVDENLSPEEKARRQKNIDIGNPFARFGYKPKIATLSKGKYLEFHDRDTIVKIGSFSYHTRKKTVTGYYSLDSLRSEATLHPTLISRWFSPDPLSDEFPSWSPYSFVFNNPIRFIDPDGRAPDDIIGVSRSDARKFKSDLHAVLSDSKFENLRSLISVSGKTFNHIDSGALATALDGVSLSTDEQTYVDLVVNTINSDDTHKVEYLSGEFTSSEGATAFKEHMNGVQEGVGDAMLTPEGKLSTGIIDAHGSGLNVPTNNGSHSFISGGSDNREVTSGHEVFGHGVASAAGLSTAQNNSNAIRADNLIRRVMGLPQRIGEKHGGYKEGQITEPQKLPITK